MADPTDEKALTWTEADGLNCSFWLTYSFSPSHTVVPLDRPATLADVAKAIEARGLAIVSSETDPLLTMYEGERARLESALTAAEERAGRAERELARERKELVEERRRSVLSAGVVAQRLADELTVARSKLAEVERALRVARGVSDGSADNTKRLYGENASLRSQLAAHRTVVEAARPFLKAWKDGRYGMGVSAHDWSVFAMALNDVALDALPATDALLTTPPAAEPVATGESEALRLLREALGYLISGDSPLLCERIEALLAKVDGGGNG
jgi:hypothetical protein